MFIAIAPNILVNSESIDIIEKRKRGKNEDVVVTVAGKELISEVSFGQLYASLIRTGNEAGNQQFWAG